MSPLFAKESEALVSILLKKNEMLFTIGMTI